MPYEVDLKPHLLASRYFSIDENNLVYHDTEMAVADIVGFAYGSISTSVNGIKAKTEYILRVIDNAGDSINIAFYTTVLLGYDPEAVFKDMIKYCWEFFGNRILNDTINKIANGDSVTIGGLQLNQEGVLMQHRPFFGKPIDFIVAWDDLTYEIFQGILTVKSQSEKKAQSAMHLKSDYNAHILKTMIEILTDDTSFANKLSGKK